MSTILPILLALLLQIPEDFPEPPSRLPDSIPLATARVAEARRLAGELEEIWPDLTASPPAVLLCLPDGNAVLMDHPGLPGWHSLEIRDQDLPLSWWVEGCPERALGEISRLWTLSAAFTLDLEGRRTVYVDLAGDLSSYRLLGAAGDAPTEAEDLVAEAQAGGGSATEDAVGWILRGLFQEWAEREMAAPPESTPAPMNPIQREQSRELAGQEAVLLAEALEAPSGGKARELGARFVRLRETRLDILGSWAPLLQYEEQMDGLALGTIYAALLLGRHEAESIEPALLALEPDFNYEGADLLQGDLLEILSAEEDSGDRALPRPGLTGFALALLLDRGAVAWREKVLENEAYLHELLPGPLEGAGPRDEREGEEAEAPEPEGERSAALPEGGG